MGMGTDIVTEPDTDTDINMDTDTDMTSPRTLHLDNFNGQLWKIQEHLKHNFNQYTRQQTVFKCVHIRVNAHPNNRPPPSTDT